MQGHRGAAHAGKVRQHEGVGPGRALVGGRAQAVERFLGGLHRAHAQAPVGQQHGQAQAQPRIGAEQEQAAARGSAVVGRGRHVAGGLQQRDLEPEGGAVAGLGFDADAPAHEVDDALGDRQAQAGAAVEAGGGGVGLAEGLEQARLRTGGDADAGVADFEAQLVLGGGLADAAHGHRYRAALGELHRVRHQVAQHLAQAHRIAAHRQAHRRVDGEDHPQPLALGRAFHQLEHAVEQLAQVEAGGFQLEPVGFELGVVEDVVDDAQHLLRRGVGGAHQFGVVGRQARVHQQVEHRHDAVERGADLVAHGGQELALGHHRRFRRLLGLAQLRLQLGVLIDLRLQLLHHRLVAARALVGLLDLVVALAQPDVQRDHREQGQQHQHQRGVLPGPLESDHVQHQRQRGAGRGAECEPAHHEGRGASACQHVRAPSGGSRSPFRPRRAAPGCPG